MHRRRISFSVIVALIAVLLLGVAPALAAGQGAQPAPITATWTIVGAEVVDAHPQGQGCLVNVALTWDIAGNLQGSATVEWEALVHQAKVHNPCDDTPGGTYSENTTIKGRFQGVLDGRSGTSEFTGQERMNVKDHLLHAEFVIVPGSGTGNLIGIQGTMKSDGPFDAPSLPLIGQYHIVPPA
jgi:hypothetical protein